MPMGSRAMQTSDHICHLGSFQELPGKNVAAGLIQTPWHGSQASICPPGPVSLTPIPLFSPQPSSPSTFPWLGFTPCCSLLLAAESLRCRGKYCFSCKAMLPPAPHTHTHQSPHSNQPPLGVPVDFSVCTASGMVIAGNWDVCLPSPREEDVLPGSSPP